MGISRRAILRIAACLTIVGGYLHVVTNLLRIDEFLLAPSTYPIETAFATSRIVRSHDREIEVIVSRASKAEPRSFVLYFPGYDSRGETMSPQITQRWDDGRTEVWCVNYPGFGRTSGPGELKHIPPDALAVFEALSRHANGRPIYISGNCLGAAAALHVAAQRTEIAGVVLQNPPPLRELVRSRFHGPILWFFAVPVSMQIPSQLDCTANAARCTAPAVFVQAMDDFDVPTRSQQPIVIAYAGRKHVLQLQGDHRTLAEASGARLADAITWLRSFHSPDPDRLRLAASK